MSTTEESTRERQATPSIRRRSFLIGLGALVAAPAIVRASSLMPVRFVEVGNQYTLSGFVREPNADWVRRSAMLYGDFVKGEFFVKGKPVRFERLLTLLGVSGFASCIQLEAMQQPQVSPYVETTATNFMATLHLAAPSPKGMVYMRADS